MKNAMAAAQPKRAPRPWGALLRRGPFAVLGAVGLRVLAEWPSLPSPMPIHFRMDGQPDRWTDKSPATALWVWAVGVAVCVLLWALGAAMGRSRSPARGLPPGADAVARAMSARIFLGAEYFVAVVNSAALLAVVEARLFPVLFVGGVTAAFVVWMLLVSVRLASQLRTAYAEVPEAGGEWKWGVFYFNPGDPSLFVPKRLGIGYTLNFARPTSWVVLVALFVAPIVAVLCVRAYALPAGR